MSGHKDHNQGVEVEDSQEGHDHCADAGHAGHPAARDAESKPRSKPYYCPMCSGVESDEPGDCPMCGMSLEPNPAYSVSSVKVTYTCPMHPQIEQDHPGDCPICGMALEPKAAAPEAQADFEGESLARKFWLGVILTVPILFLSLGKMLPGLSIDQLVPPTINNCIHLFLATVVVFWCGDIFFVRAWRSLVNRSLNMFTLIGLWVGTAYLYSAIATRFPHIFPESFEQDGELNLYFEAAAVITGFGLVGQWVEAKARRRTGRAVQAVLGLRASNTHALIRV